MMKKYRAIWTGDIWEMDQYTLLSKYTPKDPLDINIDLEFNIGINDPKNFDSYTATLLTVNQIEKYYQELLDSSNSKIAVGEDIIVIKEYNFKEINSFFKSTVEAISANTEEAIYTKLARLFMHDDEMFLDVIS